MASVKITINGVICDMYGRTISGPVKIVGEAMYSDLGVGGGPIVPPPSEGPPPGTGIWPNPPEGQAPLPSHPIALPGDPWWPKPPTEPPSDPGVIKPPPPEGGWGYHPEYGWGYFPGPTQPGPKA